MKLADLKKGQLDEICEKLDIENFDDFFGEEYTSDALSQETVDICGLTYSLDNVIKKVDPIAFREIVLDYTDNLYRDEVIEYLKCGTEIWVQDREEDIEAIIEYLEGQ